MSKLSPTTPCTVTLELQEWLDVTGLIDAMKQLHPSPNDPLLTELNTKIWDQVQSGPKHKE